MTRHHHVHRHHQLQIEGFDPVDAHDRISTDGHGAPSPLEAFEREHHARDAIARVDRVGRVVAIGFAAGLIAVIGRVAQLQYHPPERLTSLSQQTISGRPVTAARGDILDRRGRLVATTRLGHAAFLDPTLLPKDVDPVIMTLAEALGIEPDALGGQINEKIAENIQRGWVHPDDVNTARTAEEIRHELVSVVKAHLGLGSSNNADTEETQTSPHYNQYIRLTGAMTPEQTDRVRVLRTEIPGLGIETIGVREYPTGSLVAKIVGLQGADINGTVGIERVMDTSLTGSDGHVRYVRDAARRPLWIAPNALERAQRGSTVRLSIDVEIQRIAHEHLVHGVTYADAAGGRIIVLDPNTGEVLAMDDIVRSIDVVDQFCWSDKPEPGHRPSSFVPARYRLIEKDELRAMHPALGRNRNLTETYEPGSIFKPIIWSIITDHGKMKPDQIVNVSNGVRKGNFFRAINDVSKAKSERSWYDVLVHSSNVGMAIGALELEFTELRDAILKFGIRQETGIELPGEVRGMLTNRQNWGYYSQTAVSFGQEIGVTPIQMVRAFSAFARAGEYAGTIPDLTVLASGQIGLAASGTRAIGADAAILTRGPMAEVATNMEKKLATRQKLDNEPVETWHYPMFGKSGTAEVAIGAPPPGKVKPDGLAKGYYPNQYISSFIGAGPVENPRLVVLVLIDDPGPKMVKEVRYYGSDVAGPVVRRVMEDTLAYLGTASKTEPAQHFKQLARHTPE